MSESISFDGEQALPIASAEEFERWLTSNGADHSSIWLVIYNKASKKQVVTFDQLLEVAICFGWIDVKTKRLDEERYGIRFVPRRPKGNWTEGNRTLARRLIQEGRMRPEGEAKLPGDL